MKVLVTGGTGFVGSHAVAAILDAGHEVRLFVRAPERVGPALGPLGITVDDLAVGDVLDPVAFTSALEGVDAVVHAAAVYSLDVRRAEEVERTNVRAAEIVLGQAVAAGLDPVVHVSSTVALTRHGGSGPDLPLGDVDLPYSRSKIRSEEVARSYQDSGHPVVTVYPGGVYGPLDPYLGDNNERLLWVLRGLFPMWPKGGNHVVDVRDVAMVLAAVLERGRGPRRYVVPGHHVGAKELYSTAAQVTGRRLPHVTLPGGLLAPQVRLMDRVQARLPARFHYPADYEGIELVRRDTRIDDGRARNELGIAPRPLAETIRDTARWMVETGRLKPRRAPALG